MSFRFLDIQLFFQSGNNITMFVFGKLLDSICDFSVCSALMVHQQSEKFTVHQNIFEKILPYLYNC